VVLEEETTGTDKPMSEINAAILERLERVVDKLSDNSTKMGELLAVHNEKLEKQDRIDAVLFEKIESVHREINRTSDAIKKGCERDIRKVDDRLRTMEKKMWSIFGALSVISVIVSPIGQKVIQSLTGSEQAATLDSVRNPEWTTLRTSILDSSTRG
jgi:hypothetical protein